MKKVISLLFVAIMSIAMTSCTDMVVASSTSSTVVVETRVGYGYPVYDIYRRQSVYVPRYPVYALPPKEYWYRPSWRAPKPPKHEPWPPKFNPSTKPNPGFGNQVRRPDTRGPRTFNRNRH